MTTPSQARRKQRSRKKKRTVATLAEQFPSYTPLGSDGFMYVVTVPTSVEDADDLSAHLLKIPATH